jgi:hypothetical protein
MNKPRKKKTNLKPKKATKKVVTKAVKIVKTKTVKPVKVKPVKALKRPRRANLICILTGEVVKVSQSQLEKQAQKLKMSVPDYTQYYVSRDARRSLKEGYTEAEIRNKHNCKDKTELPMRVLKCYAKRIKDRSRAKKREIRKTITEIYNDPNSKERYMVKPRTEPKFLDMTNPDHIKSLTTFACARPHIFLDNGRNCKGCTIFDHCACPIKKLK